ncbi:MAG: ubiquinol-cytochrome c reductase cytochrome c subunit, partial [Glaciecola sp.]
MLPRRHRKRTVWRGLSLLFAVLTATVALTGATATAQSSPDDPLVRQGQDIYGRSCATCHGDGGVGQDTVPSIVDAGAASVDFYLSTGRMPMERIGDKLERGPQLVTDAEKRALIAYVSSLGDGPPIPEIDDYLDADIARGLELFTSNCAA